jgi:hypothetical protein
MCTLHTTLEFYLITPNKIYDLQVKSNGRKIKTDQIKISVIFECEWNSHQLRGKNNDWLSELCAEKKI